MKYVSTTTLSKLLGMSSKELFTRLSELGLMVREDESWVLTDQGKERGGTYKKSQRFGEYVVWPENLVIEASQAKPDIDKKSTELLNSTMIADRVALSASSINAILLKLDLIAKNPKGWTLTDIGKSQGGVQMSSQQSDNLYVCWPESIIELKSFNDIVNRLKRSKASKTMVQEKKQEGGFRDKFETKHRSADGHFVRSKAEMIIDNWLYMAEIVHAYERKLPIEEDVYSDFYIPTGKVYIEYWGYEDDPRYLERKQKKIELYKKYGFNLIELQDKDVQNLDDVFPKLLLKYGIQPY